MMVVMVIVMVMVMVMVMVLVMVMNGYQPDDRSLRCCTLIFSVLKNMF